MLCFTVHFLTGSASPHTSWRTLGLLDVVHLSSALLLQAKDCHGLLDAIVHGRVVDWNVLSSDNLDSFLRRNPAQQGCRTGQVGVT
jgi:hypothetical protein